MAVSWTVKSFGTIVAIVLTGGVVMFFTTPRSVITTQDYAFTFDRYQALCAIVAPWPFTTNVVVPLTSAWGMGVTNIPSDARWWNFSPFPYDEFYGEDRTVAVFGVSTPLAAVDMMMDGLPLICTNFLRAVSTNADGTLRPVYWDGPSLFEYAGIGDRTSLWTVAYETNGTPIYSNSPVQSVCTTTMWEIWRFETNLNITLRPATLTGENRVTGGAYYIGNYFGENSVTQINIGTGGWEEYIFSYSDFGDFAYNSSVTLPHEIMIPSGLTSTGVYNRSFAAGTWNVDNAYRNYHPMGDGGGTWSPPLLETDMAGEYYRNNDKFRQYYYTRDLVDTAPSPPPRGIVEHLTVVQSPYEEVHIKTNLWTVQIAEFPSGTVAQAQMISAAVLSWTNVTGNVLAITNVTHSDSLITSGSSGGDYNGPPNGTVFPDVNTTDSTGEWKLYYYPSEGGFVVISMNAPYYDKRFGGEVYDLPAVMDSELWYENGTGSFTLAWETLTTNVTYYAEGTITNRHMIHTGVVEQITFLGSLSTNIYTNLALTVCPTLRDKLTESEKVNHAVFYPAEGQLAPISRDNGTFDENEEYIWILYGQTNSVLAGSCIETGAPLCVLKWSFGVLE